MKTIGFIDYFLNEWHANEYPSMIQAYNAKNGTDYQVKYAWAEMDIPSHIEHYIAAGMSKMDAIKQTARDRGVPKNEIYKYTV